MSAEPVEQVEHGTITTSRLTLRPWSVDDAEAALTVYGQDDVARWLAPAMSPVPDVASMRALLERWTGEQLLGPQGRWAVVRSDTAQLVGGVAVLPLPPEGDDLEIGWQLAPQAWGQGIAAEAGQALARHALASGAEELFAVVRRRNTRGAATAQRVGMEWVGETEKYYGLRLQVYRLRKGDVDIPSQRRPSR
jgi:RimJ/RimL family protein N-acetyltransferase